MTIGIKFVNEKSFLRFEEVFNLSFFEQRSYINLQRRTIRLISQEPILPTPFVGKYHRSKANRLSRSKWVMETPETDRSIKVLCPWRLKLTPEPILLMSSYEEKVEFVAQRCSFCFALEISFLGSRGDISILRS
ncbi:hypothetical protein G9A89_017550 [Geosiphon pyriformis]|nr:hypothetical protein G9A89_017550 [Geosiphon pyriformis]